MMWFQAYRILPEIQVWQQIGSVLIYRERGLSSIRND